MFYLPKGRLLQAERRPFQIVTCTPCLVTGCNFVRRCLSLSPKMLTFEAVKGCLRWGMWAGFNSQADALNTETNVLDFQRA